MLISSKLRLAEWLKQQESLPRKCEPLSSNSSADQKKKKKNLQTLPLIGRNKNLIEVLKLSVFE
jgi:hypothetical protein